MEENKNIKRNMLFNTVGAVTYYFCQWFMSVIVVWISGYEIAGVFGIATTVTASPTIISLFNVRNYQVSDVDGKFSQRTYINSRLYTNAFAFVVCMLLSLLNGYETEKIVIIMAYMIYKLAEGFADVYYGIEQRYGRMDYSGISLVLRGVITLLCFIIFQFYFENLLLSFSVISIGSFGVIFLFDRRIIDKWDNIKEVNERQGTREVLSLLSTCFPLAVVAFLYNLSSNIPKMVLEKLWGEEVMGFFSSISSPAQVVQLAAITMFAPLITPMAQAFGEKNKSQMMRYIKTLIILIFGIATIALLGSFFLGEQVLILFFGIEIKTYAYLLLPCVLSMILVAICTSLYSICTVMRMFKRQLVSAFLGVIISILASEVLVPLKGMEFAILSQMIAILVQIVGLILGIVRGMSRLNENHNTNQEA